MISPSRSNPFIQQQIPTTAPFQQHKQTLSGTAAQFSSFFDTQRQSGSFSGTIKMPYLIDSQQSTLRAVDSFPNFEHSDDEFLLNREPFSKKRTDLIYMNLPANNSIQVRPRPPPPLKHNLSEETVTPLETAM